MAFLRTQLSKLLRPLGALDAEGPSLLAWALGLSVVDFWGRAVPNNWGDLAALAVIGLGVALTWKLHQKRPLGWATWLARQGRRLKDRLIVPLPRLGSDYRREPRLPSGIPGALWVFPCAGLLALGLVASLDPNVLQRIRPTEIAGLYLGYLGLLAGSWAAGLLLGGASTMVAFQQLHLWLVKREKQTDGPPGHPPGHPDVRGAILLALNLFLLTIFLPVPLAMGVLAFSGVGLAVLWVTPRPEPQIALWRTKSGDRRGVRIATVYALAALGPFLLVWAVVGGLRGSWFAFQGIAPDWALSALVAKFCAWGSAAGFFALFLRQLGQYFWQRRFHPAHRRSPEVHVDGLLTTTEREGLRRALARVGLGLATNSTPQAGQVAVRLEADFGGPADPDTPVVPTWPLAVKLERLAAGDYRVMLFRRWQLQCRRIFLRGMQRLFKAAASRRFERGDGYWVGAQHGFMLGLIRDREEDAESEALGSEGPIIGAPYHLAFPPIVRQYYHQVTRALQVDLVFVANGVRFPQLRRVFQTLFDVYDVHGGEAPIQEMHFAGLSDVRVTIQEVESTDGDANPSYAEPDYFEIGRARILVVAQNRGEEPVHGHVPTPGERIPVLH